MGLIIKVSDHVTHCFNGDDGQVIYDLVCPKLKQGLKIELSFENIDTVTSSFVNVALITLLDEFTFDHIKKQLRFTSTSSQINEMIKSRFMFEVKRIEAAANIKKNSRETLLVTC